MKWMYHKTKAPKGEIFNEDKVKELKEGWVDTPAKFKEQKKTEPKKGK